MKLWQSKHTLNDSPSCLLIGDIGGTNARFALSNAESPGFSREITLKCRIDTAVEIEYVENGGVLHYVLRNLARSA